MHVDGTTLAEALVLRLVEVVPPRYELDAWNGHVRISGTSLGRCAIGVTAIVEQDGDRDRNLLSACRSVLDGVQDHITLDTTEPWPGGVPSTPGVAIETDQILLWYGERAHPLLALRPIDIGP